MKECKTSYITLQPTGVWSALDLVDLEEVESDSSYLDCCIIERRSDYLVVKVVYEDFEDVMDVFGQIARCALEAGLTEISISYNGNEFVGE